ncbi:MAG: hypothetical protein ACRD3B_14675 [Candidatus Sulfotelmatobacter sp.]
MFLLVLGFAISAHAADWSAPEQELARKIVALTGSSVISVTFENRSTLGRRDAEIIQNGLRGAMATTGGRLAQNDPTASTVAITLSENPASYVWVAEVRSPGAEPAVVMVSVPRASNANLGLEAVPLTLRKVLLWSQPEPILDVAVLEENAAPTRIAVLSPEQVFIYRLRGGTSQLEARSEITHSRAWPRDMRGRIVPAKDHLLDVYLPGTVCRGASAGAFTLNCREVDDSWPLLLAGASGAPATGSPTGARASFEGSRNFFTGIETARGEALKTVPHFYTAALIPRDGTAMWLLATVDGQVHIFEGGGDRTVKLKWGSDITSIRTPCGAGWQVLATSAVEEGADSVRAYEIPDRDPVAVSAATQFPGPISALWTEAKGDSAVAAARNPETGNYEAFRLEVACGQ